MKHGIGLVEALDREFAPFSRGFEQLDEPGRIGREQLKPLGDQSGCDNTFLGDPSGEQNLFHCVQLGMVPRLSPFRQIFSQQPKVQKRLVAFVFKIGTNDTVEIGPIFVKKEEIQLVTGILRVEGRLFLGRKLGPIDQGSKLIQRGIAGQGAVERVNPT
ncbi:MAG: hypothetical protein ACKOFW_20985, partial [Planctomycetaceae bacterium]